MIRDLKLLPAARQVWLAFACGERVWINSPLTVAEAKQLQAEAAHRACAACLSRQGAQLRLPLWEETE